MHSLHLDALNVRYIMANGRPRVKKSPQQKLKRSEHPKVIESLSGHFYRQIDPRLKQQVMDSRMLQEDPHGTANLSEQFIHRMFNPNRFMESLGFRDERSEVGE
jgi:hypothetical protein